MRAAPTFLEEATPSRIPALRPDLKTNLLTVFVVLTNVLGNFSLSWGMKHQTTHLGLSPFAYIRLIFSPWVLVGTTLLIFWLLSRMTLLGWADLSYVLPVTSIGYVLTTMLGRYFFGEQVSWQRWLGTVLIVLGIILVGLTLPNTTTAARRQEQAR
jgi:uncharacterized membrane protein